MELITDRTATDVRLGTEKGRYNAADLNRVEAAVGELLSIAKALDIPGQWDVKTDWDLPEKFSPHTWVTAGQMERYLGNVERLCRAVELAVELPASMAHLTYQGANQIEQALCLAEKRIFHILDIFRFSGELFAGEENRL